MIYNRQVLPLPQDPVLRLTQSAECNLYRSVMVIGGKFFSVFFSAFESDWRRDKARAIKSNKVKNKFFAAHTIMMSTLAVCW